ncbi:MAG: ZIP family metal transporter [Muribaculaceae bacterium]|nr:ZIP family metal transporter [Muribaculaceae bacterium]
MNGIIAGLAIPVIGTVLGAACVFFIKDKINPSMNKALLGFAAGVMVAASIWSLLIPAMEMSAPSGFMKIFPSVIGFILGMGFLLLLDILTPHQHAGEQHSEGPRSNLSKSSKLVLAITLHNIPEGMAVGAALAAVMEESHFVGMASAIALAIGMAIQNFPEGVIVSMPLRGAGNTRTKSFIMGALSGLVEPIAGVITILLTAIILPGLPYLLSFAAGAMMYVVVEEIIPETQSGEHSNLGTIGFTIGFVIMMILDSVL